ncbi:MAG: methyl-accepting chemotaxis protein [Synergistaceae bacterium]|nr:methyl-accepting chemotaxis protein [Synergistaceae bacterium]
MERNNKPAVRVPQKGKSLLKNRFVMFSVTLFTIIFVVGSAAFIFSMRQIIRTNKGNELTQMLEIERIKLETSVNAEIAIALKLADSPLIKRYFAAPGDLELKELAFEEIASYRRAFKGNTVFWINDIDRMFYSDDSDPFGIDVEKFENYWYKMTLHETEVFNFNINYNPDLKTTNLWINAPVFDNARKPIGMVGTGINLSTFVDVIYKDIKNSTELYFFNAKGEITGSKNVNLMVEKKQIDEEMNYAGIDILSKAKNLGAGETQTFDIPLGKIAVSAIPMLEWSSVAFIPDSIGDYNTSITMLFLVVLALISLIFIIFNVFIARFVKSLHKTMESLEVASKAGNEVIGNVRDEVEKVTNLSGALGELADKANTEIANTNAAVTLVEGQAKEALKAVANAADAIEEVTKAAAVTADAAIQATEASLSSSELSGEVAVVVNEFVAELQNIGRAMQKNSDGMSRVETAVASISGFVTTIGSIASQTNLLALNAAIEAARAGDAGRGFAVVAEEVRKLAEESNLASRHVAKLIEELVDGTSSAINSTQGATEVISGIMIKAEKARGNLADTLKEIHKVDEAVQSIAGAAQEQAATSHEISRSANLIRENVTELRNGIGTVSNTSKETSTVIDSVNMESKNLTDIAANLLDIINDFKTDMSI